MIIVTYGELAAEYQTKILTQLKVAGDLLIELQDQQDKKAHLQGCLHISFQNLDLLSNKGFLRLQCLRFNFLKTCNLPEWHLQWDDGLFGKEGLRFIHILEWIQNQQTQWELKELERAIYSRCSEVVIEFDILSHRKLHIPVGEIIHIKAKGELSILTYGHDGPPTSVVIDYKLGACEIMLKKYGVIRVHRSHLINLGCIQKITQNGSIGIVHLCHNFQIAVARRRFQELHQTFENSLTIHEKLV